VAPIAINDNNIYEAAGRYHHERPSRVVPQFRNIIYLSESFTSLCVYVMLCLLMPRPYYEELIQEVLIVFSKLTQN